MEASSGFLFIEAGFAVLKMAITSPTRAAAAGGRAVPCRPPSRRAGGGARFFLDLPAPALLLLVGPAGLADASNQSDVRYAKKLGGWDRSSITKTEERCRSANLLQMTRGLMCKLRQCGRGYGGLGPAGCRGIDPSLQPSLWSQPARHGRIGNPYNAVTLLLTGAQKKARSLPQRTAPTPPRRARVIAGRSAVMASGGIKTCMDAEGAIKMGADLVAVGRAVVVDPEWLSKVRSKSEASILAGLPKDELDMASALSIPPRMVEYLLSRPGWIPRL